ncbi:class I SAM-dependent methyltransferase [Thalassospira australica]|uniref:class I SAM-dependent methyltransferase n=1 Tax=Thalassospira australica TaxID=1528106 RepID=UPI00051A2965|nr:class I SAM-dependent methyltransferase [Thalassospira australica]
MTDLSVLVFVGIILALIAIYAIRLKAVPMPTSGKVADEIIAYIPSETGTVTDLGSGWGDLAIAIARARPDIEVTGIELSPVPFAISRMRAILAAKPNLSLIRADFRTLDHNPGEVVVCFLDPRLMDDVGDVLSQRMDPGAIVISRAFAIPGWQAFGEIPMKTSSDRLYLYRFGSHKAGITA